MGNTAQARASYRSALRSGDLRRPLGTQLISSSGSWAYNVALMVYLYDRTHSASWVAAGALGRFLPTLACSGYAGVIAERYEQVRLMVRLNLLALVLQLGLALAAWRAAPAAVVIVLAGLTSVVLSPYNPAVAALIPQVVREGQLAAANALNATSTTWWWWRPGLGPAPAGRRAPARDRGERGDLRPGRALAAGHEGAEPAQ